MRCLPALVACVRALLQAPRVYSPGKAAEELANRGTNGNINLAMEDGGVIICNMSQWCAHPHALRSAPPP